MEIIISYDEEDEEIIIKDLSDTWYQYNWYKKVYPWFKNGKESKMISAGFYKE